jgi:hypothetical protein
MPANLIRSLDGFDAESMMVAFNPAAAAGFAAALAFTRAARPTAAAAPHSPAVGCACTPESSAGDTRVSILGAAEACATLLRLLDNAHALSISARVVLLGALGIHSVAPAHVQATARLACAIVSDLDADGAARAVAARVMSQLSARAVGAACSSLRDSARPDLASPRSPTAALRTALRSNLPVGALAAALDGDPDRYVRGHVAEALASIGLLGALEAAGDGPDAHHAIDRGEEGDGAGAPAGVPRAGDADAEADRAALAALSSAVEPAVVEAEAERLCALWARLRTSTDASAWVAGRHDQAALAVHTAVRAVCAHRRCPLTGPESPF